MLLALAPAGMTGPPQRHALLNTALAMASIPGQGLTSLLLAQAIDVTDISGREVTIAADSGIAFGVTNATGREITFAADSAIAFGVTQRTGREITFGRSSAVDFVLTDRVGRDITAAPATRVQLTVDFQSLANPLSAPNPYTVDVVDPGTGQIYYSLTVTPVNQVSTFLIPQTLVRVSVKDSHWLRDSVMVDGRQAGPIPLSLSLKNGDVDGNNEVGPGDFSVLSTAFGTFLGDPGYVANADLNRDEEIGPADFSILAANFGEFGSDP